jgi:hypothetical protein
MYTCINVSIEMVRMATSSLRTLGVFEQLPLLDQKVELAWLRARMMS